MRKLIAAVMVYVLCLTTPVVVLADDQRIQATEAMVGANHPSGYPDTLNRLTLIEHNSDGTHKYNSDMQSFGGSIQTMLTEVGSQNRNVIVSSAINVGSAFTIPANITISVVKGGSFVDGGGTLSFLGSFIAGPYQVFDSAFSSGDILFTTIKESDPVWWGATSNVDGTDSAPAFTKAGAAMSHGGIISPSPGRYYFSTPAVIPWGTKIKGSNGARPDNIPSPTSADLASSVIISPSGTFTDAYSSPGFLFYVNIEPSTDPDTWVEAFPNDIGAGISNIAFINGTSTKTNAIKFATSGTFENIFTYKINQALVKPNIYLDHVTIKNIYGYYRSADGTDSDYFIDLPGNGDAVVVSQISPGYEGESSDGDVAKGVYIASAKSGDVFGIINGDNVFAAYLGEIRGCHIERGSITLVDSGASVHDNYLWTTTGTPLVLQSDTDSSNGNRFSTHLYDNQYITTYGWTGGSWSDNCDIKIDEGDSYNVTLDRNYRVNREHGTAQPWQTMGIIVCDSTGTVVDDWKNYSHTLSKHGEINRGTVKQVYSIHGSDSSFDGFDVTSTTTDNVVWSAATGTYYYSIQVLYDPVRLIGRSMTGSELAINVTNGGDGVKLFPTFAAYPLQTDLVYRLYRGTSTGSYDYYVDLPVIFAKWLYEDGSYVNNFAWVARSAGPVDTLNGAAMTEGGISVDTYATVRSGSNVTPTAGTWVAGDYVQLIDPTVNSSMPFGYIRKTSGSNHVLGTDWLAVYVGTAQAYTSTTTALEDMTNAINTTGKFAGKQVWNSSTLSTVWSAGTTSTSVWVDGVGATAHTPI